VQYAFTSWMPFLLTSIVKALKNEKKHSEATQTLRTGCSKAEPKYLAPPQTHSRRCRTAKI